MLNWISRFSIFSFLDSSDYTLPLSNHKWIAAAGCIHQISCSSGSAIEQLEVFRNTSNDWCFGHLGYDLKNEIHDLSSANTDTSGFPDLFFFIPEVVLQLKGKELIIGVIKDDPDKIFDELKLQSRELPVTPITTTIRSRMTKEEYIAAVKGLQAHIRRGDTYEVNFCQEFYASAVVDSPAALFGALLKVSPNPFAAYYRVNEHYLFCASPERFLKKEKNTLTSQPIKGTIKRGADPGSDKINSQLLLNSAKEKAENVMVVDLVRNDLSKICRVGTVIVEELMGLYSFPQVHQLISTVRGEINEGNNFSSIIQATFPMGSMTGAPKLSTMKLIEKYETFRRGLFSGSVGYFSPDGDFDFNVVIRSLLLNSTTGYLSFPAGSGITYYSDPAQEYEECILKAMAIKKVLAG